MDRISNGKVEVQFDATSVAWRPGVNPSAPTERLQLTASDVLRGLMGLTDALPPRWAAVADEEIASGALVKHEPDADGWRWIVAPTK